MYWLQIFIIGEFGVLDLYHSINKNASAANKCAFVCLGFLVPLKIFSLIFETSPLPVKGCKYFDLCSALMGIEQ